MRKKERLSITFGIFLFLSCSVFAFHQAPLFAEFEAFVERLVNPAQLTVYHLVHFIPSSAAAAFISQNDAKQAALLSKLSQLETENRALRDQFQTSFPNSQDLLPAAILGTPSFPPGAPVSNIIVNQGRKDGVIKGQSVVYKDNLVGEVTEVSEHLSRISLVTTPTILLSVKTAKTKALGVLQGTGRDDMTLDKVVLSDTLSVGDIVMTSGDENEQGVGILPGLIVGKLTSVQKKPSALFQTGRVESFLDMSHLTIVFIVMPIK